MTEDMLARLKEIDMAILNDVVKKDQGSPSFEISEWSVKRLSSQGVMNPDGLWLFSGEGSDRQGSRPWSVVLKIIQRPEVYSHFGGANPTSQVHALLANMALPTA